MPTSGVFPTGVGMNRVNFESILPVESVPHGRGDELGIFQPLPGVVYTTDDKLLSGRLDAIEDKIDNLLRKIDFIFGNEVLVNGKFRRFKK